jgi:hypothetical protein
MTTVSETIRRGADRGEPRVTHLVAYIDPGTGSLIVQALIATLVAVPFFFRQQIARIIRSIRKRDA